MAQAHEAAKKGPVTTKSPTLADYLARWLEQVVRPELAPATAANDEMFVRLYIVPTLGKKRLDKLTVADVRTWLHKLRETCQCCGDARRDEKARKCCAVGRCCGQVASERTCRDAWTTLRAALSNAVREEIIPRNVAALLRVSKPRKRPLDVHPRVVMRILRHSQIAVTMDIYSEVSTTATRKALRRLGKQLG